MLLTSVGEESAEEKERVGEVVVLWLPGDDDEEGEGDRVSPPNEEACAPTMWSMASVVLPLQLALLL